MLIKNKKYIFTLLIVFIAIAFFSCEKDVIFNFKHESKLCLNCILNPDSTVTARLTLSRSIENNSTFQPVDDATIVLYENDKELDMLISAGEGYYHLDYYPESLKEYKVTVTHPDFEKLTAKTVIPQKTDVSFASDTLMYHEIYKLYLMDIDFIIHDLPGKNSYWLYGKQITDDNTYSGGGFSKIKAPFIDDFNRIIDTETKYGYEYSLYVRISDAGFDAEDMAFKVEDVLFNFFSFLSADEHYDKYIKSSVKYFLNSNEDGDFPFEEPVQIYNNIKNGYGIFGSCAITAIKLQ